VAALAVTLFYCLSQIWRRTLSCVAAAARFFAYTGIRTLRWKLYFFEKICDGFRLTFYLSVVIMAALSSLQQDIFLI